MEKVTTPIVNISKGFPFKARISEKVRTDSGSDGSSEKKYIAVLRLHNRKDGIMTNVDSEGWATWTDKQTATLRRNKKYDLEVWDYSEKGKDEVGHKIFVQENIGKAVETYVSMNGKVSSDFDVEV